MSMDNGGHLFLEPLVTLRALLSCAVSSSLALSLHAEALKLADVSAARGDGSDKKGNTSDDKWQFWFELAHSRGEYRRLTIHTSTMTAAQRRSGIRRKVRGPVGGFLPNPKATEGWIYHRDWDGRFEGIWADTKSGHVIMHPYVEKGSHCAVAITYRIPKSGRYDISGKLTDLQVNPEFPKHDGILWRVERVTGDGSGKGKLLGKGGPIGDGRGRPESGAIHIKSVELKKSDFVRLVVHPNQWWGRDLTRIHSFKVTPSAN